MMRLLRRHRKVILWVLVALIVPPFVVWGGYRGCSGDEEGAAAGTIARVGGVEVNAAAFRRQLDDVASRQAQYRDERPTFQELAENGTAQRILDRMINTAILNGLAKERNFRCERPYLVERLKEYPQFQTEDGRFDSMIWNAFVESDKNRNWNALYESVNEDVSRQVVHQLLRAPARVLEPEIRRQFELDNTDFQVRYIEIKPKIEPTEEEIKEHYEENPDLYKTPEKRVAEFVAISRLKDRHALAEEIVKRARGGDDFAELAKEYSDEPKADEGGDMGWLEEPEDPIGIRKALFDLKPGEVSDVLDLTAKHFIFKVEDERTTDGKREIKARQVVLNLRLSTEEWEAIDAKAEQILEEAKEADDLAKVAAEYGLEVKKTDMFSEESETIENVAEEDVRRFRRAFDDVAPGEFADLVMGSKYRYVAKVLEVEPAKLKPLEEVRDEVIENVKKEIQRSDDYAERVDKLAGKIAESVSSLDEIPEKFPELDAEIKESAKFNRKDSLILKDTECSTSDLCLLLEHKEPSDFIGPVKGYRTLQYFFELVSKEPPGEQAWNDEWPEKKEELAEKALQSAEYARLSDYIEYMKPRTPIQQNSAVFAQVIGFDGGETTTSIPGQDQE